MAVEIAVNYRSFDYGGAEYMAAFGAIQELIGTKGVLGELGFDYVDPMILHMDSQSALALAKNPTHHKRSKHIDIKYHWLREYTLENNTVLCDCRHGRECDDQNASSGLT